MLLFLEFFSYKWFYRMKFNTDCTSDSVICKLEFMSESCNCWRDVLPLINCCTCPSVCYRYFLPVTSHSVKWFKYSVRSNRSLKLTVFFWISESYTSLCLHLNWVKNWNLFVDILNQLSVDNLPLRALLILGLCFKYV